MLGPVRVSTKSNWSKVMESNKHTDISTTKSYIVYLASDNIISSLSEPLGSTVLGTFLRLTQAYNNNTPTRP